MLSDDTIDKLIQPILNRQMDIDMYVLDKIATAIKETGEMTPSQLDKMVAMVKAGADAKKINKQLAIMTGIQVKSIKKLIKQVAYNGYMDAKPFYDYRKVSFIPFNQNKQLQTVVNAVANQTASTYMNMSNSGAFMIRDPKNPKKLIPTPPAQTYQTIVDEAIQATQGGVIDYNTAMEKSLKEVINSGIQYNTAVTNTPKVKYESEKGKEHYQRLDTAMRRNILNGVRNVNQQVQNLIGKTLGLDGVEITVHENPAPDHAPVQGHQFTNKQFQRLQDGKDFMDINGQKFGAIDRPIGQWNCRHFTYSIKLGRSKPMYSQAQLNAILQRNQAGYTLPNGKHLTMYECTQKQRQYETTIRYLKEAQMTAKKAGNLKLAKQYQAKLNDKMKEYQSFSNACGLSMKLPKIKVDGYKPIQI